MRHSDFTFLVGLAVLKCLSTRIFKPKDLPIGEICRVSRVNHSPELPALTFATYPMTLSATCASPLIYLLI